ncbi:MAG: restriction endonuclease subunit S [Actinobacteria bacterium]|nr:restriction endonuclease subunit S [Actinomycetota bacterium]
MAELGADLRQGFSSGKHNSRGAGVLHVRPMNITPLGEIDTGDARYLQQPENDVRLQMDDIVFNNTNSVRWVGKTSVWTDGPAAFSNHITRIRLPKAINPEFVAKQLQLLCLIGYFSAHCRKHVNQASISLTFLKHQVPIRIPQVGIQDLLLHELASMEQRRRTIVASLEESTAARHTLQSAVLEEAFEPGDADTSALSDLVEQPLHYGIVQTGEDTAAGVPTVRAGDLSHGPPDPTQLKRVTPAIERKYVKTRLTGGEVLLSIRGTVGYVAVAGEDLKGANVSREVCVIRPGSATDPRYLALYLSSPGGQQDLQSRVRGVAQQGISLRELATIRVPVRAEQEQRELVAHLEGQLKRLGDLALHISDALDRAEAMHRVLLENVFCGLLETTDADSRDDPESASELIARAREEAAQAPRPLPKPKKMKETKQPLEGSEDVSNLVATLELVGEAMTPAALLDGSDLPNDDVERFYRAIVDAIGGRRISEAQPDSTTVLLQLVSR